MELKLQLGLLLALACAVATNVAFLLKHRGAMQAPPVSFKHPLQSAVGLFRSRWFALGMAVACGAWLLHVAALALAPLSLVQAVLAGGVALIAVLAERGFGHSVGRRQWLGVGLTASGLMLLAVTNPGGGSGNGYSAAAMALFEGTLLSIGLALALSPGFRRHPRGGVVLGLSAGVLFGVSDVALKALATALPAAGPVALVSPWAVSALAASIAGFYASARGLQVGDAVGVITVTSASANVTAIAGGLLVFAEPLPSDPLALVAQVAAFIAIVTAATLLPAPVRAAQARAGA